MSTKYFFFLSLGWEGGGEQKDSPSDCLVVTLIRYVNLLAEVPGFAQVIRRAETTQIANLETLF